MAKIPQFEIKVPEYEPVKQDIIGKAREFIEELDESISNKDIYKQFGVNPYKTYLLSSPPGMGKTYSIRVLNNTKNRCVMDKIDSILEEIKMHPDSQIEQKIEPEEFKLFTYEYDIGKYGTAYINIGSRIVQSFFDTAFKANQIYGTPILISVDECDSLFYSRRLGVNSSAEDRKVLNTLMKNIQIAHDKEDIYVVLMTNLLEHIDEASIRAGRIDKRIVFNLPNFEERKFAYERAIEKYNNRAQYKVIREYNLDNLSEISEGFNYADIFQTVENALRYKAKQLIRNKTPGIKRIGYIKGNTLEKIVQNHKNMFKNKKIKKIGFI